MTSLPFQPTLTPTRLNQLNIKFDTRAACAFLRGIVYSYLQVSVEKPTPYLVVPDGTQAIYMSPTGIKVGGAFMETVDLELMQPGEYFGIWFHPGALRHLFKLNLSEITGQFVDSQFFPCPEFRHLHIRIFECRGFVNRARICEEWVLRHFHPIPESKFDQALSLVYDTQGNQRVDSLAKFVGWSSRHLNRQFLQYTGLSTKAFSKIVRAQYLGKQLYREAINSIHSAVDLGFYDQAHLIKEFKQYYGSTPEEFKRRFMSDFYNP